MNKVFDLLYLIQEDGDITQRVLSDKLMVSLGQINNLIKNATDAGYLIHDQSYVLTEKGKTSGQCSNYGCGIRVSFCSDDI